MSEPERYDVVILGSGQGGKHLAWYLGSAGRRVAVVERRWVGGSCPAVACMPSKNEVWSARVAHTVHDAERFGTLVDGVGTDMRRVVARKREMVEREAALHLQIYEESGAELVMGSGEFIAPRTLAVASNGGGNRVLVGDEVVIDVGSHAAVPSLPGMLEARPLTHVEALELDAVPERLIVLGGGYTGLELAQAFRRFGSEVSVIEQGAQIMPREDADAAAEVRRLLEAEGVRFHLGAPVVAVTGRSGDAVAVTVEDERGVRTIDGSHLLVAVGRVANTAGIGLEAAGVAVDAAGFVRADDHLRTTAENVWAIGECAGSPQFTHVSIDDFRIVRDNMAGGDRKRSERLIPYIVFTDPPLAHVGLSEGDAERTGTSVRTAKLPMRNVLRTETTDETDGFLKILVGADHDRIVGFTMVGADAGDVMSAVQTAMLAEMPYRRVRDAVFAHLTASEGLGALLERIPAS